MYCVSCGLQLPQTAKFCWSCGTPQTNQAPLASTIKQSSQLRPAELRIILRVNLRERMGWIFSKWHPTALYDLVVEQTDMLSGATVHTHIASGHLHFNSYYEGINERYWTYQYIPRDDWSDAQEKLVRFLIRLHANGWEVTELIHQTRKGLSGGIGLEGSRPSSPAELGLQQSVLQEIQIHPRQS